MLKDPNQGSQWIRSTRGSDPNMVLKNTRIIVYALFFSSKTKRMRGIAECLIRETGDRVRHTLYRWLQTHMAALQERFQTKLPKSQEVILSISKHLLGDSEFSAQLYPQIQDNYRNTTIRFLQLKNSSQKSIHISPCQSPLICCFPQLSHHGCYLSLNLGNGDGSGI